MSEVKISLDDEWIVDDTTGAVTGIKRNVNQSRSELAKSTLATISSSAYSVPQIIAVQNTPSAKTDADTAEATLYQFTIPGGLMGPNDTLRITHLWTYPNSATTKNLKMYVGTSQIMSFGVTTTQKHQGIELFRNRNSLLSQISNNDQTPFGPRAAATLATTVDMSVDQIFKATGAWGTGGTGTNSITLESIMIELLPGNA